MVGSDGLLLYSAAAGAASWAVFHKHIIRGDHAALAHVTAFIILYVLISVGVIQSTTFPLLTTLSAVVTYASTAVTITISYRLSPWHPLASYPGPLLARVTSLWLSYISFTGKRYAILDGLHAAYGPFLRIGPYHLSLNSPSATSIYQNWEKSESYRFPGHDGAVALFFKQDTPDLHRERKNIWAPLFTPSGLAPLIPQFERRTWELLRCLERRQGEAKDGFVNLPEAMYHWAHDFMGDMVFGGCNKFEHMKNGDPENIIHTSKVATGMLDSLGQTPWLMDILWHAPTTKKMHLLTETAAKMMRKRVKSLELPDFRDLASYLLDGGISQEDMEQDAIVAIVGGADNTSITIAIAIYFLLTYPKYYTRLLKELSTAFPNPTGPLPFTELTALPFLNAVINETLRLASPYFQPRQVPKGGSYIDGKYLTEGTVVAFAAHSQQTSPDNFFPSPLDFHPERWLPEGLGPQTKTNKAVLASFSMGPHVCIGKRFAYQQMRYALARLVLAFDMALPPDFDAPAFRAGIQNVRTMFLERELLVRITRRPGVDLSATEGAAA